MDLRSKSRGYLLISIYRIYSQFLSWLNSLQLVSLKFRLKIIIFCSKFLNLWFHAYLWFKLPQLYCISTFFCVNLTLTSNLYKGILSTLNCPDKFNNCKIKIMFFFSMHWLSFSKKINVLHLILPSIFALIVGL